MSCHYRHAERFDVISAPHNHSRHPRLNLIDLCQDNARTARGDSITAVGKRALERELLEQSRPNADRKPLTNCLQAKLPIA